MLNSCLSQDDPSLYFFSYGLLAWKGRFDVPARSGTRQRLATKFLIQHVSEIERISSGLSHRKDKTELLQHSHHIVVAVHTDDFPGFGTAPTTEPLLRILTRRGNIPVGICSGPVLVPLPVNSMTASSSVANTLVNSTLLSGKPSAKKRLICL